MTDIRRVHHRSSSKHEYDRDYDHDHKSKPKSAVCSRVVKKEAAPVSTSSKRLKITVTNDRRSSISPPALRSKPAKARSKSRSRSRGRKTTETSKASKKTDAHKTKKVSPPPPAREKTKAKESRKKKSRSPPRPAARSRSPSPARYYNYPYHHYYDYYHGYGSRSRSPSRSPDPYRSKPAPYPSSYYAAGAAPSRYRHMYPGMRYPAAPPPNLPYYPPQGYMAKFGKMARQRFYPAEDAEPYYAAGVRHAASYKPKKDEAKEPDAEVIEEPKSPSNTDPELTELVCEITSAIANASAEGREYVLSEEQKRTLEKHQQLIQDYQQKKQKYQQLLKLRQQSQLNPEQMSMLLANKKFPNYRLLGRNIFEPNNKQKVFQKRIKTNTYYSRFIKQHPTNNLPLVFQKSIGLNEDKEEESGEKSKKKKSKKKKKKSASSSGLSSGDDDDDSGKKSRKRVDDVLEDGQIQPVNNESGSSSSGSESSASQSSSSSLSNQSERRARRRKAAKFNNDARNGHTDSDSSMLDLKEHLKPIGSYIKDRERMLNEMFRCIKGSKLKAMLPDILKTKQLSQIKERCLEALECMSKKRIRCLITDQPMLSSSGTEESSEDEDNSSLHSDSERSFGPKKTKTSGPESKFRPIGADTSKPSEEPGAYESNEDSQASQPGKEEKAPQVAKSNSAMAAAGFKNFVKKSISIKIKTNDQFGGSSPSEVTTLQSSASQLTDLQKQQMAISNKLARKIKTDTTAAPFAYPVQAEQKTLPSMPKTSSDLTSLAQIRPQVAAAQQTGLLPTPNQQAGPRPAFMQNSFAYGPSVTTMPPSGVITRPPGVYPPPIMSASNIAYNIVPQTIPQPFHSQGQSLLGPVPTHLPPQYQFNQRGQDDYPSYLDEEEELADDAAYDLDDNAYNYDLDEDLDSIMNESRSKRKDKESRRHRSKKSSKKHKRKKYESESESESVESVKEMLRSVLEAHMDQLDDDDARMTLGGLLDQIVNDDGSLTYDDCVNIHESVKALFGEREEGEESDEELKRRKKKKSSAKRRNKSSEDLKPSKKKRKENGKRAESEEGEIDDVYDDDGQFIVQKEYQDLLLK